MAVEDPQHLLASLWEEFLRVSGVRHRLTLLRVAKTSPSVDRPAHAEESAYFNLMWRRFTLGMSRTNIHRTLKTPFHLSDAQTVLLLV